MLIDILILLKNLGSMNPPVPIDHYQLMNASCINLTSFSGNPDLKNENRNDEIAYAM